MNQYQSSSSLKDTARRYLSGKYGQSALLTFLSVILVFLFSFIAAFCVALVVVLFMGTEDTLLSIIIEYITTGSCTVVAGVLNAGIALFFLNIACGNPYSVGNLFYCFQKDFGKCLLISAAMNLPQIVCMFPYEILNYLYESSDNLILGCLALTADILGIIVYLPITLALSMSFYLMLDFPSYSAKEVLQMSLKITKGHKGRLFYIQLSFLPLIFLSIFSWGIGLLWVTPYMNLVQALFFLDLMKNRNDVQSRETVTDPYHYSNTLYT